MIPDHVGNMAAGWLGWITAASWQLAVLVALVAAAAWLCRGASPGLRYALWLLVLVKVFLPPSLSASWGLGAWGIASIGHHARSAGLTPDFDFNAKRNSEQAAAVDDAGASSEHAGHAASSADLDGERHTAIQLLFAIWLTGAAVAVGVAIWRYFQLRRATARMQLVDEGPARVELERIAMSLGETRPPELFASETAGSPFLFGVLRPAIVAPRELLDNSSADDVRTVLIHEAVHWRRRDPWVGWVQVIAQALFWFHPLVWLANARIRQEREAACDEAVLRFGACEPADYGQTLLQVLSAARGRSYAQGNLVGVFERGGDLQARLEAIMNYQPNRRTYRWAGRAAVALFALVFLPMAAPATERNTDTKATRAPAADANDDGTQATPTQRSKIAAEDPQGLPEWQSIPAPGARDVDPGLNEIVLTFDRPMAGGMSWTGGGPNFPRIDESREAHWRDEYTCVLPVWIEEGKFYRVGVNSSSFENFQSRAGVPARHGAVYFTTRGAKPAAVRALEVPKIVETEPADGATNIDPATRDIRITFSVPMAEGFSWTGETPLADGASPRWSRDGRTCILPAALKPGTKYVIGVNGQRAMNFQSKWGVPLPPATFSFTTGETNGDGKPAPAAKQAPRVVKMVPENGATEVNPAIKMIRVTFDRPMAEGFSWTGGGPAFPTIPEGKAPRWSRDRKSCTLPVELEPGKSYRLGLNSASFKNFASRDGVPLEPIEYRFTTGEEH